MSNEPTQEQFDELQDQYIRLARDNAELATRYDDAIERIHNLTAELEYLRREVSRG